MVFGKKPSMTEDHWEQSTKKFFIWTGSRKTSITIRIHNYKVNFTSNFYLCNRLLLLLNHCTINLQMFCAREVINSASMLSTGCDECQCRVSSSKHTCLTEHSHEFWVQKFVAHSKIKIHAISLKYAIFTSIFTYFCISVLLVLNSNVDTKSNSTWRMLIGFAVICYPNTVSHNITEQNITLIWILRDKLHKVESQPEISFTFDKKIAEYKYSTKCVF